MFLELLKKELLANSANYFPDNYDSYTFGTKRPLKKRVINQLKRVFFSKLSLRVFLNNNYLFEKIFLGKISNYTQYIKPLEFFYNKLETDESKKLLLQLISFRLLGYVKVKLPLSTPEYWDGIKQMEKIQNHSDFIELKSFPWKLNLHEIKVEGTTINSYINSKAAYTTFVLQQYVKQLNGQKICPKKGDTVLDLGGCYGDTALFFSHLTGNTGKIFSFEFIPSNIKIFQKNLSLNPLLKDNVQIIEHPLWSKSGMKMYYKDAGAGSSISFENNSSADGETSTISVDDFVERYSVKQVDFIKSDIEGAEPEMLRGAINTLKKFTPTLAISIYHNMNDFTGIIRQIDELNLGYKFYLGHYTIYASETILYAVK